MNHENCEHVLDQGVEPSGMDRRRFLGTGLFGAGAMLTAPAWMPRVSFALGGGPTPRDTLVVIFQRGASDGLTLCAPYGDGELYNRRPSLASWFAEASGYVCAVRPEDAERFESLCAVHEVELTRVGTVLSVPRLELESGKVALHMALADLARVWRNALGAFVFSEVAS